MSENRGYRITIKRIAYAYFYVEAPDEATAEDMYDNWAMGHWIDVCEAIEGSDETEWETEVEADETVWGEDITPEALKYLEDDEED